MPFSYLCKYYFKIILFIIGFCFYAQSAFSQVDSTYIRPLAYPFSLKINAANKFSALLHEHLFDENTYNPNRPLALGVGFTSGKIGMSFSYGFEFLSNKAKGHTESFDIQYHNYGRRIVFDVIGQLYKGYYNDDKMVGNDYQVHQNLRTIKVGLSGQYVFNSTRFSYSSTFSQKELQLKSAGSLLLGAAAYYNEIHSDLPGFFKDSLQIKQINFQLGPTIGYAYNWVVSPVFYISASVSGGFNLGFNDQISNVMVYPTAIPRFAAGYNMDKWGILMSYVNNLIYTYYSENRKIALSSGGIQLTFIRRFDWHLSLPRRKSGL